MHWLTSFYGPPERVTMVEEADGPEKANDARLPAGANNAHSPGRAGAERASVPVWLRTQKLIVGVVWAETQSPLR
jgi:hypothetical protein